MILRFRSRRECEAVIILTVFAGETEEVIQNCGELRLQIGEWQLLGATLLLGYDNLSLRREMRLEWEELTWSDRVRAMDLERLGELER